eukprot:CAMPEP_0197862598 /NCGR_PEP_ID=MMETSP1438-20131217/39477_1 /TAXON_ID=1461541 /ORGANISM="Pterosperma sp., Strain CCMP1384" /LENGTH=110 /DNA_ID=CAMNT_0043480205 /DNA_START=231 /DNA_END=559 /DNA_ORIENTATION=-
METAAREIVLVKPGQLSTAGDEITPVYRKRGPQYKKKPPNSKKPPPGDKQESSRAELLRQLRTEEEMLGKAEAHIRRQMSLLEAEREHLTVMKVQREAARQGLAHEHNGG